MSVSSGTGGFESGSSLGMDTTGGNATYAGAIANPNSGANALGLVKLGPNVLTLTNAGNTYSGPTKVLNGTLLLSGAVSLPNSTLYAGAGGVFSTTDGAARTTTLGGLNLGGSGGLAMDWGDVLSTSAIATGNGNITLLPSGAFSSGTPYTLVTAAGGLSGASYSLYLPNASNYTASLSVSTTGITVTPTNASPLTTAYWYGGQVPGYPAAMAVVQRHGEQLVIDATSTWPPRLCPALRPTRSFPRPPARTQQANVVPGANITVNSLTFNDTTPVTIGNDGNTLTLASSGVGPSSAINVNQPATLNGLVTLNAAQTVTINTGTLTLGPSGLLSGGNSAAAIANSGTFVANSGNAQTFSGVISGPGTLTQSGLAS